MRERFAALVLDLDDVDARRPVRSCPGWSVHDVVAHHVGAVVDISTGHAPEIPADVDFLGDFHRVINGPFADLSARQVRERTTHGLLELEMEWRSSAATLWGVLRGDLPATAFPLAPQLCEALMINDVVVHEGDVRQAVGAAPAPAGPALSMALANYGFVAASRIQAAGLPALRLAFDGQEKTLGAGEPAATLRATRHDLVRVLAARRSREQILAMDWDGEPDPYVDLLPAYGVVQASDADVL